MSQKSALIHEEGGDVRQNRARYLSDNNQWGALLQVGDYAQNVDLDSQEIEEGLRFQRSQASSLREYIDEYKRRSEQLQRALYAANDAQAELDKKIAQLQPLAENAGLLESQLRQREEEVHQAYAELKRRQEDAEQQKLDAAALAGEIERVRAKLTKADKWIFRLAGERRDNERALAALQAKVAYAEKIAAAEHGQARRHADALVQQGQKLTEQRHEIDRLSKALDTARSKLEAVPRHGEGQQGSYATDIYPLSLEIRRLADEKRLAEHKCWDAEQEAQRLVQEVSLLTRLLYVTREKAEQSKVERSSLLAESAKVAALSKELQASHETQEKVVGLLAELQAYCEELERKSVEDKKGLEAVEERFEQEAAARLWMVRLSEALIQRRPFWWHLASEEWRSRWTYASLRRRGIFDSEKYCDMYPDVPAAGMDPLEHYVKHGMQEGRFCPL